jgi:hypothetical protein
MVMVICVEAVAVITTDGIAVVDIIGGTIANHSSAHVLAKRSRSLRSAGIPPPPVRRYCRSDFRFRPQRI